MKVGTVPKGSTAVWLSPFAGALAVAVFLTVRALVTPGRVGAMYAFLVWFIERAAVGYVCTLPLLGIAYRAGLRHIAGFMLLASMAAIPLEHYTSTPINAWHPTDEELDHGIYWVTFLPSLFLASLTGAAFAWGVSRPTMPNQSTDPTLASGTAGAEHQPRHP